MLHCDLSKKKKKNAHSSNDMLLNLDLVNNIFTAIINIFIYIYMLFCFNDSHVIIQLWDLDYFFLEFNLLI